jgi:Secretion system C-terminal sorting domain
MKILLRYNFFIVLTIYQLIIDVDGQAQSPIHCSEILNTTTPTVNVWDWRTEWWDANINTNVTGPLIRVVSPFHSLISNNDNSNNSNIRHFAIALDKDYKPDDGWELLAKNLGVSGGISISDPYVIFYNKNTGIVRSFFLIAQLFSETLNNDAAKGGSIKISFYNKDPGPLQYQSNLLTSYSSPLLPLDQLKRDADIIRANEFRTFIPYWLYADFPVIFDPCTCSNKGSFKIETSLINSGNVDIKIESLPYQSPVKSDAVNKDAALFHSFSDFSGKVGGGLSATRSTGEALGTLRDAVIKQPIDLAVKLDKDLVKLKGVFDKIGKITEIIPVAGAAYNAVISLVDFFSGGGGASSAPSPIMIMNDFKATGTISSSSAKNIVIIPIPGSDQSGITAAAKPVYNNILGVFNLLYTPRVTIKNKYAYTVTPPIKVCGPWGIDNNYWISVDAESIKFTINPVLNIDLSNSTIKAALIVESGYKDVFTTTNLQHDISQSGGAQVYRSSYYPLNSINECIGYLYKNNKGDCGAGSPPSSNNGLLEDGVLKKYFAAQVYLKVIAKLHPTGATNYDQDIIFIAKYPVKINYVPVTQPISAGIEDLAEDIILPENLPIRDLSSFTAFNTISIGSTTIGPLPRPVFFKAGEAIILREGGVITPLHSIRVGGIYSSTASPLPSLKATSAELTTFCGGSGYNGVNNERNIASRQAAPEEVQLLTKEEFFTFYPNPATDQVTFKYFIEEDSPVRLSVMDLSGKPVGLLIDEYKEMGDYVHNFDASDLAAGMYIIKFESDKMSRTEKLVVIK